MRVSAQDLGLELEKRNISKEAEVSEIVDAGLEALPGVSSTTTFMPNPDLTPREVTALENTCDYFGAFCVNRSAV